MSICEVWAHRPSIKSVDLSSSPQDPVVAIEWKEKVFFNLLTVRHVQGIYTLTDAALLQEHIQAESDLRSCPPEQIPYFRKKVNRTNDRLPPGLRDPRHK